MSSSSQFLAGFMRKSNITIQMKVHLPDAKFFLLTKSFLCSKWDFGQGAA